MKQFGLMQEIPLLLSGIIEHAAQQFGDVEIVARETHGALHRYTYKDCAARARQLANALAALDLVAGDAVGTIAWNNHRHMEVYYAVSGSGMVLHTCNPRLHPQQLIYIINHAEDKAIFFDATFAPLVKAIAPHCPQVRHWIALSDASNAPTVEGIESVLVHDLLLAPQSSTFDWPSFDERTAAALCYTSGTTGNPKGALYSHRAIVLNALSGCSPNVLKLSTEDAILPVVPMFHINAWCVPYAAPMAGTKLVFPGPKLDGASLYELLESERVTISAGVPTIWLGLVNYMEQNNLKLSTMKIAATGGSAMPKAMIAKLMQNYGVEVRHGWGMTETTAVATMGTLSPKSRAWDTDAQAALLAKQGKSVYLTEIKVVDDTGATLPRDGESQGELMVRGHWIVSSYHKGESSPLIDGWFPTGDIATIDADGVLTIRDRTKDVIKSGGEWISSIDLENAAIGHPAVAMAAVIGVKHAQWDERPLLLLVRKPNAALEKQEILDFLADKVAKWWIPDDVVFVEALPVGGTGKVQKNELRKTYGGIFS